jgi:large subunit ribosomal protein L25
MSQLANPTLVGVAKTLPPRLLEFFRRFPPTNEYAAGPQRPELPSLSTSTSSSTSASEDATTPPHRPSAKDIIGASIVWSDPTYNPFQPWKNPITGRWRGPMYSLRRQAEMVKLAQRYGVEELLPYTDKMSWVKEQKREEHGLRVKGTGVGQKVKGKEWERTQKSRLEKRRQAMLQMPEMIQQWKEVCFCPVSRRWWSHVANVCTERSRSWVEEVAEVMSAYSSVIWLAGV